MKRFPFLIIVLVAVAIAAFPASVATAFQYDRAAVNAGAWWRLIACQWTHWSVSHLVWDLAVFVAIGIACEQRDHVATARAIGWSAGLVPLVVHFGLPQVRQFRGLSGIDCALFGLLAARLARGAWTDRRGGAGMAVAVAWSLFALKTLREMSTDRAVFVGCDADVLVVPVAHIVGLAIGSVCAIGRQTGPAPTWEPRTLLS